MQNLVQAQRERLEAAQLEYVRVAALYASACLAAGNPEAGRALLEHAWDLSQTVEIGRQHYRDEAAALQRWKAAEALAVQTLINMCDAAGDAVGAATFRRLQEEDVLRAALQPLRRRLEEAQSTARMSSAVRPA